MASNRLHVRDHQPGSTTSLPRTICPGTLLIPVIDRSLPEEMQRDGLFFAEAKENFPAIRQPWRRFVKDDNIAGRAVRTPPTSTRRRCRSTVPEWRGTEWSAPSLDGWSACDKPAVMSELAPSSDTAAIAENLRRVRDRIANAAIAAGRARIR